MTPKPSVDQRQKLADTLVKLDSPHSKDSFDDFLLPGRIATLAELDSNALDVFSETKEEAAHAVFRTIARQFNSGVPSVEAIKYVAILMQAYLNGNVNSLDAAFFWTNKKEQGGQKTPVTDELAACRAYQEVIINRTQNYDAATKTTEIEPVTSKILEEARMMAFEAYYGVSWKRDDSWETKFKRTVAPILKKHKVIE